jgi:lysozyme
VRKVNKAGVDLIREFEGCKLEAYPDPASPLAIELRKPKTKRVKDHEKLSPEPVTVGWGTTGLDHFNLDAKGQPTRITLNTVWTQDQCDARNEEDLLKFSAQVEPILKVSVNDNQFAALVSFAYNLGVGNLKSSSLLRLVNEGKFMEASVEFLRWNKANGKVLEGLTRRREAEKALFVKRS